MANILASVSSLFGAKSPTSRRAHETDSALRDSAGHSSYLNAMASSRRGSAAYDARDSSISFEDASFSSSNGAAYPPQQSGSFHTPTMQQNGFDTSLQSPSTSHYPPSQSPFVSPASGSRLALNGSAVVAEDATQPSMSYPSLRQTFARLATILGPLYPELLDTLGNPVSVEDLSALNAVFGRVYSLPRDVRESLACHDGQDIYSLTTSGSSRERAQRGLVWGLWLMTTDEIGDDYRHWRTLERREMRGEQPVDDPFAPAGKALSVPGMASCPAGWVREEYSHPGWIPLLTDGFGNYVGIDMDPPSNLEADKQDNSAWSALAGRAGQVIGFGRDIDCKTVLFPGWGPDGGWARFLSSFVDDLESGEFGRLGRILDPANSSQEDLASQADGLGEVGYFDEGQDRPTERSFATGPDDADIRQDPPSGGSWVLKGEYAELSPIEALCLRSRKRWAEVGLVGSNQTRQRSGSASFAASDLERSESLRTVRPASPKHLIHHDAPKLPPVAASPEPSTSVQPMSDLSVHEPERSLSPPVLSLHRAAEPSVERAKPRRPPPPPAQLDLPTLGEMDAFSTENLPPPISTASSPRSSSDRRRNSSDRRRSTMGEILPMSTRSPSPAAAAMPPRKESFGLSRLEVRDEPPPIQVVVQGGSQQTLSPQTLSPIGSPTVRSQSGFESPSNLDDVALKDS